MKVRNLVVTVLALLFVLATAAIVAAHAELVDAQPAPGATLPEAPTEIRLTFSEPVGAQSEILLFGHDFQAVDGVVAQVDPAHPEEIVATLPALAEDTYTVQWSATSDDGHEISGSYSFTVGGEAAASGDVAGETHSQDAASAGSTAWSMAALGLVGGALLLILVQRFLQGS